jgi:hypothetical protein
VVEVKLKRVWRKERLKAHLRGASGAAIALVSAVLLLFAGDWLFDFPAGLRAVLSLGAGVGILALLYRTWWSRLRPFDPMSTAVRAEERFPELNSLLISFVELNGSAATVTGSRELMDLVRQQAVGVSEPIDFGDLVQLSELRRLLLSALGASLILAGTAGLLPEHLGIALRRLAGADVAYPTRTRFLDRSPDARVRKGQPVELRARVGGAVPRHGRLWIRPAGQEWQSIEVKQSAGGAFAHALPPAGESFDFYFEIGDARSHPRSKRGHIDVVHPPVILASSVRVEPPAYTGEPAFTSDRLGVEAPEGSRVRFRVGTDQAVTRTSLLIEGEAPVAAAVGRDGREVEAAVDARRSLGLRFRWTVAGSDFEFESDPFSLQVRPDRAPAVTLLKPRSDQKATVEKRLALEVRVKDDYGIARLALGYRLNEQPERRVDLGAPSKPADQADRAHARFGTWPVTWALKTDLPQLKPGDKVVVWLEAEDVHAEGQPSRSGRSQERTVEILSLADYNRHILERLGEAEGRLAETHGRQKEIDLQVEGLLKDLEARK